MRKTTAALSALALSAIALTGCSASAPSFDGVACERDSSAALATKVQADGELGSAKVNITAPVRTSKVSYADLITGEGAAISSATQFAIVGVTLVNGNTGDILQQADTFWSPESASQQFPGLGDALECATDGSRVAAAIPSKDLPEGMSDQIGLKGNESLVVVSDVRAVMLQHAEGESVFNDANGLPTVVRAADGHPGVIVPDSAAPKKAVTQTLIKGHGDKIGADVQGSSPAVVRSMSVGWKSGEVRASSWETGVENIGEMPEEVQKAVKQSTIGSQVMVVVPGESGDATVYVVDVVGEIPAELMGQ